MSQEPNKTPIRAEQSPATGTEIACIALLLAVCVMANSWLVASAPEPAVVSKTAPAAIAPRLAPSPTLVQTQRPSRDRPSLDRERPWRDPKSDRLPGF